MMITCAPLAGPTWFFLGFALSSFGPVGPTCFFSPILALSPCGAALQMNVKIQKHYDNPKDGSRK